MKIEKVLNLFTVAESITVGTRNLFAKASLGLAGFEATLYGSKVMFSEKFDTFFAEHIFSIFMQHNPVLAGSFARTIEKMATSPDYFLETLNLALGLMTIASVSWLSALGVHYSREYYLNNLARNKES